MEKTQSRKLRFSLVLGLFLAKSSSGRMGNVWAPCAVHRSGESVWIRLHGSFGALWKNRFAPLGGFATSLLPQSFTLLRTATIGGSAASSHLRRLRRFAASQLRKRGSALRAFGSRSYYHKTKVALRPSVASPPHSCLKALRCFAQLRSAATPPLPTFGIFAASQLRKRGSALRAFGSRSYYHKTKVALRPSVASPPHSCLKALRCFAQLRSAAPPPLPTFGGFAASPLRRFAASQLRKRGSALRAFGSRSYYHKTKVALRPSVASPPHSCLKALRCFAQLRSAAPPPLPTFGGFAASPLRSSAREARPSGPSDLVPTITKQKSLCAPPRWLRHLAFANASQLCGALHSYDRRLRRLFPPSAASPLRSSAREARPSGPSDLVPTITKQKSLCAPRWLRHLTLASKLYVALHSYDRRLRRLFPPSAASPLRRFAAPQERLGPPGLRISFLLSQNKSRFAPLLGGFATSLLPTPHSFAVLCTATIGGYAASSHLRRLRRFAAPQERLGPPGLRISFLLSQNKSRFAPLLGGFATSLLPTPHSFAVLCTATIGGYTASSHLRRLRRFAAPQKRLGPRAFGSCSYYHKTDVALRPSSAASPTRVNAGGNDDSWSSWVSDVSLG
ncbi:hypothetical protein L596_012601 [Steinernema carpocapsae]|uniref:Uncharacterized protein n=1 Tax=Steinernema carpocapsae TaxID=34508 RepID=A0A4V6A4U9_STECR|nr:hypothetical protein L596_012601 [Steinernema carpocapsae]